MPSWFERVGYEYAMSPALLLGAVEQARAGNEKFGQSLPAARLYEQSVADRLTALANLSPAEREALWSSQSEWELNDPSPERVSNPVRRSTSALTSYKLAG